MYAAMNGPPIIEYEKIVQPVEGAQKGTVLNRHSEEERQKRKKHENKLKQKKQDEDLIFEPFVGMLFDYSA